MSGVRERYEWDDVQRLLGEGDAPTPDDVSVALDGRRLDTAEAVVGFFEELRLERERGLATAENDSPPLDVRSVVEALDRHHVEYVLVGGLSDAEARSLPVVIDATALGRMEISTWRTTAGYLDVLHHLRSESGGHVDYDELSQRSIETDLGGLQVWLASLDDIVASKRFADRDKDRHALPELERMMREIDGT